MQMRALERLGKNGREVKIHVISYMNGDVPQLFTGYAYDMRMNGNFMLVNMRPWIAFYPEPPRIINKDGSDVYQDFMITNRDIIYGSFMGHKKEARSRDLIEGRGRLKITPELREYFELAQLL